MYRPAWAPPMHRVDGVDVWLKEASVRKEGAGASQHNRDSKHSHSLYYNAKSNKHRAPSPSVCSIV